MKVIKTIALVLVVIGGLNWGLIGFANFDLVVAIFGDGSMLTKIVYSLVGVSAVIIAFSHMGCCKKTSCCSDSWCESKK